VEFHPAASRRLTHASLDHLPRNRASFFAQTGCGFRLKSVWVLTQQGVGSDSTGDGKRWLKISFFPPSGRSVIYSNITQHWCVFQEGKGLGAPDRGDDPTLRPAFRVRRGTRPVFGSMTRHDGSRASGYPPDVVSFRRCAGAPADCVRLRWGSGVLALRTRWSEPFGKPTRSGGAPKRTDQSYPA
jgi:hypothetical protein